ncbi:MAG: histidine kinase, partial [Cyanobacteria bacterium P01_E01_bin.48]
GQLSIVLGQQDSPLTPIVHRQFPTRSVGGGNHLVSIIKTADHLTVMANLVLLVLYEGQSQQATFACRAAMNATLLPNRRDQLTRTDRSGDSLRSEYRSARKTGFIILVTLWFLANIFSHIREAFRDHEVPLLVMISSEVMFTITGMLLCVAIYLILERLQEKSTTTIISTSLSLSVCSSMLHIFLYFQFIAILDDSEKLSFMAEFYTVILWFHFYIAWSAIALALLYSTFVRHETMLRARAEAQAHNARMRALRYQLNPHFLFNTLNSIAALALDRNFSAAGRMVDQLANFLDLGINDKGLERIPLQREIAYQVSYLAIEMERFSDRLDFEIDMPENLGQALVPSFIMQPLIENAIKHGAAKSSDPVLVRVTAAVENEMLLLTVTENSSLGPDHAPGSEGIGLRNIRDRLHEMYHGRGSLAVGRVAGVGHVATIAIPLDMTLGCGEAFGGSDHANRQSNRDD